jgi:hypothetical protein
MLDEDKEHIPNQSSNRKQVKVWIFLPLSEQNFLLTQFLLTNQSILRIYNI